MENRILIVDDEEMICFILAQRLFREKYLCTTANDGREALSQFHKNTFSLIISDIKMPEMDGIELLKRVKTTNSNMMVIMITAFPEIDLAMEAMHLGAYDFILKPVDLELVVFSVKRALEKKRLEEEVEAYHKNVERQVEERTAELRQTLLVLKKAHFDSVKVLAEAIDAKDPYTRGHSDRVKRMSLGIATRFARKDRMLNRDLGGVAFCADMRWLFWRELAVVPLF